MSGPLYADRVQETTTTAGTGTVTLAGAVAGYQSFATAVPSGTQVQYCITDNSTLWEVGLGVYTSSGTTLTRVKVLSSSNSGALVTLAGTCSVFLTQPAAAIADTGTSLAMVARCLAQ